MQGFGRDFASTTNVSLAIVPVPRGAMAQSRLGRERPPASLAWPGCQSPPAPRAGKGQNATAGAEQASRKAGARRARRSTPQTRPL
jgi:hypothetical protein